MSLLYQHRMLIALVLCAGITASCRKFVDAGSPKSELTTDKVFADSIGASAALTGIYISMNGSSAGFNIPTGLSADELTTSKQGADAEFLNNNVKAVNSQNAALWTLLYQQVYQANACVEGIAGSPGLSTVQKERLSAEARLIRAYLFFNLVNLYGPVPLVTMTDYRLSGSLPRSGTAEVYSQIISDLKFAQSKLDAGTADNSRANYYAAAALLARVYLYNKNYAEAEAEATKVIGSGRFSLANEPGQVFLAGSKETIWRLVPVVSGRETWEAASFVPSSSSAIPPYVVSERLLSDLPAGDKRSAQWTGYNTVNGRKYIYPYKYKKVYSSGTPTESYTLIRLAELYLIRAEARTSMGAASGAIADLQVIQKRANGTLYNGNSIGLADAIALECRKELFCEMGHRWFDLKRTGRADTVLGQIKTGWRGNSLLFPIPQSQLDANPSLTQNPGY